MLTRGGVNHAYGPLPMRRVSTPGAVKTTRVNNIPQTWAISRPGSGPDPTAAPFYTTGHERPNGPLMRTGAVALTPAKPNVEMDPSDPSTWQRSYLFTK